MFTVHYNNKTYNAKLVPQGYSSNGNTALLLFEGDTSDGTLATTSKPKQNHLE